MKLAMFAVAAVLLVCVPDISASTDCARQLVARNGPPYLWLPPDCRAMGPLRLGMSHFAMLSVMGPPDLDADGSSPAVYVYPRDLAARLKSRPRSEQYLNKRLAYISVTFHDGKIETISSFAASRFASIPLSVGGISIHESVDSLLQHVATRAEWNSTRDNIIFDPYPIVVAVDNDTRDIIGITISNNNTINAGGTPSFVYIRDLTNGLVDGFRVHVYK